MARAIVTQLMFEGTAEEAMTLYVSLFKGSEITRCERYGPGEQGAEGSVKRAEFTLAGHRLACIDSPIKHGFAFTPSMYRAPQRVHPRAELERSDDGEVIPGEARLAYYLARPYWGRGLATEAGRARCTM